MCFQDELRASADELSCTSEKWKFQKNISIHNCQKNPQKWNLSKYNKVGYNKLHFYTTLSLLCTTTGILGYLIARAVSLLEREDLTFGILPMLRPSVPTPLARTSGAETGRSPAALSPYHRRLLTPSSNAARDRSTNNKQLCWRMDRGKGVW